MAQEIDLALDPMLVKQALQAIFRGTFPELFFDIVKNSDSAEHPEASKTVVFSRSKVSN